METVRQEIRQSLGLSELPRETFPVEGHACDYPFWSFSKRRSTITELRIDYPDGSYFLLDAPKGLPSVLAPGYLDVLLYWGQRDLFRQDFLEIPVYRMLKYLELDPTDGRNYQNFRRDMRRFFAMTLETDRFIHPETRQRSHVLYYRILDSMMLAKSRKGVSRFYFNRFFLSSLRAGYLKRLDFDFCLYLDRCPQPLARFLYGHLLKRIGTKSVYKRNLLGFLNDIGLGHVATRKRQTEVFKRSVVPALNMIRGHAFQTYEMNPKQDNLLFLPLQD